MNSAPRHPSAAGGATRPASQPADIPRLPHENGWALLIIIMVVLAIFGGAGLLGAMSSPPELDEIHTMVFARDTSLRHAMWGLAHGTDTNAPLVHLITWVFARLLGDSFAVSRLPSLIACVLAVYFFYATLREARLRAGAAAVAALSLLAHRMVLFAAVNARFYDCWLATAAATAYFIGRRASGKSGLVSYLGLALSAAAMCMCHYYGVLSLTLMIAGYVIVDRRKTLLARFKIVSPTWLGFVLVIACLPMIRLQRAGLTIPTWVGPLSLSLVKTSLGSVAKWPCLFLTITAILVAASAGIRRARSPKTESAESAHGPAIDWAVMAAPLSLLAIPLVMALVSLVQPSFIARYMQVSLIGAGALLALLLNRADRAVTLLVGIVALAVLSFNAHKIARGISSWAVHLDAIDKLVASVPDAPIVGFTGRFEIYPLWMTYPQLRPRLRMIDFGSPWPSKSVGWGLIQQVEQDMSRHFVAVYGQPQMIPVSELRQRDGFILVPSYGEVDVETDLSIARSLFPDFEMAPLGDVPIGPERTSAPIYFLTRAETGAATSRPGSLPPASRGNDDPGQVNMPRRPNLAPHILNQQRSLPRIVGQSVNGS